MGEGASGHIQPPLLSVGDAIPPSRTPVFPRFPLESKRCPRGDAPPSIKSPPPVFANARFVFFFQVRRVGPPACQAWVGQLALGCISAGRSSPTL